MSLLVRPATEADLPLLARMNKRLIEDEGSRNPMSIEQLTGRMRGWLSGDWEIRLFVDHAAPLGYAVYQPRPDEYFPDRTVVYLRQFYIEREVRGRGWGKQALSTLVHEHFPPGSAVVIDVLASNPGGFAFWRRVGFDPYCTTMHLRSGSRPEPAGDSDRIGFPLQRTHP